MNKLFSAILVVLVLSGSAVIAYKYWPYIFSKNVIGVISDVQRVAPPAVLVGGSGVATATELFSFAVAIRQKDGEIATASSEDRQWAVAKPGQCVEAKYFPYPPWDFEKAGTYYGARLVRLYVCKEGSLISTEEQPGQ